MTTTAQPPVTSNDEWRAALDELRVREKAATRELDAIAAQRRRLPMVRLPEYMLVGKDGPVRLAEVFEGKSQLITYHHMWHPNAEWQCGGCTSLTTQYTRLGFLEPYDARFVIVTQGPIDEALVYADKVGNRMTWYSTADSPFGADVDAPPVSWTRSPRSAGACRWCACPSTCWSARMARFGWPRCSRASRS